jgi:hypothetical protein
MVEIYKVPVSTSNTSTAVCLMDESNHGESVVGPEFQVNLQDINLDILGLKCLDLHATHWWKACNYHALNDTNLAPVQIGNFCKVCGTRMKENSKRFVVIIVNGQNCLVLFEAFIPKRITVDMELFEER